MRHNLLFSIFIGMLLAGCERHDQPTPTTIKKIEDVKSIKFSMIAFKTGEVSAYNPLLRGYLLQTRYSDAAAIKIRSVLDEMESSCILVGFSAVIDGGLVQVGRKRVIMLNIEQISDLKPLSDFERKQLRDRSPTLSRAKMCDFRKLQS